MSKTPWKAKEITVKFKMSKELAELIKPGQVVAMAWGGHAGTATRKLTNKEKLGDRN